MMPDVLEEGYVVTVLTRDSDDKISDDRSRVTALLTTTTSQH